MFQVQGTCKIRPDRKGRFPSAGFRAEALYAFIKIYTPNGTTDLHFLVIDDQGSPVPLRMQRIQAIEAFQAQGTCKIRPDESDQLPAGFRPDALYTYLETYKPNGTSDLHFIVIDDQGSPVPFRMQRIQIIETFISSGDGGDSDGQKTVFIFNPPVREWSTPTGFFPPAPAHVTCIDLNMKTIFQPHEVTFSDLFTHVTVQHSRPKAGFLIIS